jgi:glutathione S-transferase
MSSESQPPTATVYVVPGSHPSMAARLELELKGIAYRRVDLLPAIHKPILRVLGFPGTTVPALRIAGRRYQGSRRISRALDDVRPEPPLFPAGTTQREAVEEAERWGEEVLQPVPRRLVWWALARQRDAMRSFAAGARLHVPLGPAIKTSAPIIAVERRVNDATDDKVRADLKALQHLLDRVDVLLASGTLGGTSLNAADYQIATSVRLLLCFDDLAATVDAHACGPYSRRVVPDFPGQVKAVFPREWMAWARRG